MQELLLERTKSVLNVIIQGYNFVRYLLTIEKTEKKIDYQIEHVELAII